MAVHLCTSHSFQCVGKFSTVFCPCVQFWVLRNGEKYWTDSYDCCAMGWILPFSQFQKYSTMFMKRMTHRKHKCRFVQGKLHHIHLYVNLEISNSPINESHSPVLSLRYASICLCTAHWQMQHRCWQKAFPYAQVKMVMYLRVQS